MNTDRANVSSIVMSNSVDRLLWNISYINNAVLSTPLKKNIGNMVLQSNEILKAMYQEAFPQENSVNQLVFYSQESDKLFIEYVESVVINSSCTAAIKLKWQESNSKIAYYLNDINPYWKFSEWNGMLSQSIDLLEILTTNLKKRNYAVFTNTIPICRRLALDMADYITAGIVDYHEKRMYNEI